MPIASKIWRAIRLHCRNTHFGKDLGDTVGAGVDIVCGGLLYCNAGDHTVRAHFFDRFKRQVGIDAADAIAKQQCKMMHFARFGRFDNNGSFEPAAAFDQMMMQAGAPKAGIAPFLRSFHGQIKSEYIYPVRS